MDPKSKAKFINSVADNKKIPCPKCNTLNEVGSLFCMTCGASIDKTEEKGAGNSDMPFAPIKKAAPMEENKNVSPFTTVSTKVKQSSPEAEKAVIPKVEVERKDEERNIFAEGLPAWDIVPPQVIVRRKKK